METGAPDAHSYNSTYNSPEDHINAACDWVLFFLLKNTDCKAMKKFHTGNGKSVFLDVPGAEPVGSNKICHSLLEAKQTNLPL